MEILHCGTILEILNKWKVEWHNHIARGGKCPAGISAGGSRIANRPHAESIVGGSGERGESYRRGSGEATVY